MRVSLRPFIAVGCFCMGVLFSQADEQRLPMKHVETELSEREYREAGLHKLTPEERVKLSGYLFGWKTPSPPVAESATPTSTVEDSEGASEFGEETLPVETQEKTRSPKQIQSRLTGPFTGWNGGTVFELENGQVWRQTDDDQFIVEMIDPKVTIRRGLFGVYFLSVEGYNSSCKVKRIR